MKNRLSSALIISALLLILCLHAFAAENDAYDPGGRSSGSGAGLLYVSMQGTEYTDYMDVFPTVAAMDGNESLRVSPDITANGHSIGRHTLRTVVDGSTYIAAVPLLKTLYPDITIQVEDGHLTAATNRLALNAEVGNAYFQVNERYLYAPAGVREENGVILMPVRELCSALGCSVLGDQEGQDLVIRQVENPVTASVYPETDLYWLSHAIYAESGNQPMKGRIAVGTVILNRVADPAFPNTVQEVIFQPRQFDPVANGTIYLEPDKDSIVAAKLCLDGVREAENCLFFNTTSLYSWADRARTYFCTIGDHNFYL